MFNNFSFFTYQFYFDWFDLQNSVNNLIKRKYIFYDDHKIVYEQHKWVLFLIVDSQACQKTIKVSVIWYYFSFKGLTPGQNGQKSENRCSLVIKS